MTARVILDTTIGEIGDIVKFRDVSQRATLVQVDCDLASGDVVVIEGRASNDQAFKEILRFTESGIFDISAPSELRASRLTDGGIGDSRVELDDKAGLS